MSAQVDTAPELWERFAAESPEATRVDIGVELDAAERECVRDSEDHLLTWLEIVDEALHFTFRTVWLAQSRLSALEDPRHGRAFMLQMARACSLTTAIRRLTVAGLGDAAITVTRSLWEALNLAMVASCDREFAELFDHFDYDPTEFWKKHIGYSRLGARLDKVLESAGYSRPERDELKENRVRLMQQMSESLHSSIQSALSSFCVPSLARPGRFGVRLFGNVSGHSPRLLFITAEMIHQTGVILCRLIERDQVPLFVDAPWEKKMANFYTAFLTLQELLITREPLLDAWEERWEREWDALDEDSDSIAPDDTTE